MRKELSARFFLQTAGIRGQVFNQSVAMYLETLGILVGLGSLAYGVGYHSAALPAPMILQGLLVLALGLWFNRLYLVGHEAVHRKLIARHRWINDGLGMLMLLPVLAPLTIYRKIHHFHHARNRQAPGMATLDTFVTHESPSPWRVRAYHAIWFGCVFCGGFFLHTAISILLFLMLPTSFGEKLSPAFKGWTMAARLRSWGEFSLCLGFHGLVVIWGGWTVWLHCLGLPLFVFVWIWSLLLYIYHYRTEIGPQVTRNVRSLSPQPFLSWFLLNFNEHSTHHANPGIPWYQLPEKCLPEPGLEDRLTVWQAIWQQRRGPLIVQRPVQATVQELEGKA